MNPRGIFKERDPSKGGGGEMKKREKKNFVIAISIHLINFPSSAHFRREWLCLYSIYHAYKKELSHFLRGKLNISQSITIRAI